MRTLLCFFLVCAFSQQHLVHAGCFFCCSPPATLSEQIAGADVVAVVKWKSSKKLPRSSANNAYDGPPGETIYEISEVLKDAKKTLKGKSEIAVDELRSNKPANSLLLFGSGKPKIHWSQPTILAAPGLAYIKALPESGTPKEKRLKFFLEYLEDSNGFVAEDAYAEISKVPFEELQKTPEKLLREKLRKWIGNKTTPRDRIGLYGEMLGVCGHSDDVDFLKDIIELPVKKFRIGMDGIMSGYLLLAGEPGLQLLEDTKLKPGVKTPFGETYCAMQAVRFAWYSGENINKDRLKQSMRILLDRPELADLALSDLIRWKDWECQEKVMSLYDRKRYDIPIVKRAIVRYLLASRKDATDDGNQNPVEEHAKQAAKHLATIRRNDPETYNKAKRYFDLFNQ